MALALDALGPDVVVVEGPPELERVVPLLADPGTTPPVAGLVYDVAHPRRSSFYPMAAFSPEWVAIRWALRHGVPVRFADLPARNDLALGPDAGTEGADTVIEATDDAAEDGPTGPAVRQDPIAVLARAAGYADPERWWEDAVEQRHDSAVERFAALAAAIAEVRRDHPGLSDEHNERREASMRQVLRSVLSDKPVAVAVVCGAFHAPALDPATFPSAAADARRLKGLPKTAVAATWAPWTSARLAYASGYGAGVEAPGWYQHLFDTWAAGDAAPDAVAPRTTSRRPGSCAWPAPCETSASTPPRPRSSMPSASRSRWLLSGAGRRWGSTS